MSEEQRSPLGGYWALDMPRAEKLAIRFHRLYEELAPEFGYQTRAESAKPWADVPEQNRRLMIAVCEQLLREGFPG